MLLDLQNLLRSQAEALADVVRATLETAPVGNHRIPWRQSGELAGSIAVTTTPEGFTIGSSSPVALAQELGTQHIPPRPFLAPAASSRADAIAQAVGAAATARIEAMFRRR